MNESMCESAACESIRRSQCIGDFLSDHIVTLENTGHLPHNINRSNHHTHSASATPQDSRVTNHHTMTKTTTISDALSAIGCNKAIHGTRLPKVCLGDIPRSCAPRRKGVDYAMPRHYSKGGKSSVQILYRDHVLKAIVYVHSIPTMTNTAPWKILERFPDP